MKLNITTGILLSSLAVFSVTASAGTSAVSFLAAISGQAESVSQNVKDANPGKNLANQNYIRSITGAVDRVTPEVKSYKLNVSDSVKLYTNQFEN